MFNRSTLKIMVPKERKSEGQGGQVGQEDRLEQIKEDLIFMEDIQKKYLNRRNKNIIKYGLILSSAALIILFFSL